MEYLEWTKVAIDLAKSLVWPLAVIIVVLLFRRQVIGFLDPDRVDTFEAGSGGIKLTLRKIDNELAGVRKAIEGDLGKNAVTESKALEEHSRRMREIAAIDPPAAVFAAAARFESTLRSRFPAVLHRDAGRGVVFHPMRELVDRAVREGVFSDAQAEGARKLNRIRNEIAHEYNTVQMSTGQAIEFCELARQLESAVELPSKKVGAFTHARARLSKIIRVKRS